MEDHLSLSLFIPLTRGVLQRGGYAPEDSFGKGAKQPSVLHTPLRFCSVVCLSSPAPLRCQYIPLRGGYTSGLNAEERERERVGMDGDVTVAQEQQYGNNY